MTGKTEDVEADASAPLEQSNFNSQLQSPYKGEITLRLNELPVLKPIVLPTGSKKWWRRLVDAGQRRTFTLAKDFVIEVEGSALPPGIEGRIVIPTLATVEPGNLDLPTDKPAQMRRSEGEFMANIFDGASIPLPWLVSYMSFGVLRPLGILLCASVVHDFAYQFGYLPVDRDGKIKHIPVARHDADELFRLITQTLNGSNFFSRVAWHAVRIGWWGIDYAGQKRTGQPPVRSTIFAIGSIICTALIAVLLRNTVFAQLNNDILAVPGLLGLLAIFIGFIYGLIALESYYRPSGVNEYIADSQDN